MLELYQFESCPFCAQVRETLDELGLDYIIRTVSPSRRERPCVEAISGQTLVPVLVDPERKTVLAESRDIIAYLRRHYGAGRAVGD